MDVRPQGALRWVLVGRTGPAQATQVLGANILVLIVNLVTGALTARALGPAGRGALAAIIYWPATLGFVATLGIPGALAYHLRKSPELSSQLISVALLLSLGAGVVAGVAGIVIVPLSMSHYAEDEKRTALIMLVFVAGTVVSLTATGALVALRRFRLMNALALAAPASTLLILVALLAAHRLNPINASVATLLPGLPPLIILLILLMRRYGVRLDEARTLSRRLLSYGSKSYGVDAMGSIMVLADQAVVLTLLGPALLGLYVVALRSSRFLNVVQTAITPVLFSRVAGGTAARARHLTGQAVRVTAIVMGASALTLGLIASHALSLVFGPGFNAATTAFRVLLVEMVVSGITWVLIQSFLGVGRPGVIALMQTLSVAVLVVALILLVPRFGIVGASCALLMASLTRCGTVIYAYPRVLGVPPPSIRPRASDFAWIREACYRRVPRGEEPLK